MDLNELKILKDITLLYVEDDIENLEEMNRVLGRFFANIYIAKDGNEGLNYFKNSKIDIILTDIHMPNLDGIEMVKAIRELNKQIPIVIITAYSKEEQKERLKNININKFIVKPIDVRKLIKIILSLVKELLKKEK